MRENIEQIHEKLKTLAALKHSQGVIYFDMATIAPKDSFDQIGDTLETLTTMIFDLLTSEEFIGLVENAKNDELTPEEEALIKDLERTLKQMTCVPREEFIKYPKLSINGEQTWLEAREAKDFSLFAPALKELVEYKRKYADYKGHDGNRYNALLDDYEPGLTTEELDVFFADVKENLVPFIQELSKSEAMQETIASNINKGHFDKEKQKGFMEFIAKQIGYDFNRGVLSESTHPFSSSTSTDDSRITTKYELDDVTSSIFSVLHEVGHARYENNVDKKYEGTPLAAGVSMGIHESQSRMYENMIGRSKAFWEPAYKTLQAFFPENYENVDLDTFIRSINIVQPSLIRVDADEVTYPLHIMVRYDLEKALINGEIEVEDLPTMWNQKMKEYLGVEPANDLEGVLQDIHWTDGSFGYFPTYALGSAYSAQFYNTLAENVDVEAALAAGDMTEIEGFLRENIHRHGSAKMPNDIIMDTTGEKFDSTYYTNYLKNKYSDLFLK